MDDKMNNKRGQVAIFVIVAIIIVILILLFFFLRGEKKPISKKTIENDPRSFIDSCVKENVNEVVDKILPLGGFIKPWHSKLYNNLNITYLCYNIGNYHPCLNEHPMLMNEIKNEIKEYIEPRISQCFDLYKFEMEKRDVKVLLNPMKLDVDFGPSRIYIDIERKVSIFNKDEKYSLDNFNIDIISPLYDMTRIAMEIASQEAKYCYFEYVGYMILYPKFKIKVFPMSYSTKIYTIIDKNSKKEMNIAIRSCAIPAGF